ncbi:hypothetical protein CDAR_416041 [Caerostris darwini]|uniref:Uncharacterized protein n=1 Tax=Caerostris darwini TaxID=1538125 RepID=A0AAV4ULV4_9ARAC|nr:hypothetical protein CDAR_416041 [Caerostris darwini]
MGNRQESNIFLTLFHGNRLTRIMEATIWNKCNMLNLSACSGKSSINPTQTWRPTNPVGGGGKAITGKLTLCLMKERKNMEVVCNIYRCPYEGAAGDRS